jgi:trehalose 6-phosphate phosphatase
VREAVAELVDRFKLVAVVTGRRAEEVEALLRVPGVRYEGLYGMESSQVASVPGLAAAAREAAADVPEAWVEDKGATVSVHYRGAADPTMARGVLSASLSEVADAHGLSVVEGKMVIELVPPDRPMKGDTVKRLAAQHALEGTLFAGDDVADLDAFRAMDELSERGLVVVKVAVSGDETPPELVRSADVTVSGPDGLVALLRQLT